MAIITGKTTSKTAVAGLEKAERTFNHELGNLYGQLASDNPALFKKLDELGRLLDQMHFAIADVKKEVEVATGTAPDQSHPAAAAVREALTGKLARAAKDLDIDTANIAFYEGHLTVAFGAMWHKEEQVDHLVREALVSAGFGKTPFKLHCTNPLE